MQDFFNPAPAAFEDANQSNLVPGRF